MQRAFRQNRVHRVNAAALAIQRAHRGHVARMCSFLSDTHVLSVNAYGIHDFMPVSALDRGSKVLAFNGEEIEVWYYRTQRQQHIRTLHAGGAKLCATANHRIVVPNPKSAGGRTTVRAASLVVGDVVFCFDGPKQLDAIDDLEGDFEVATVGFTPDLAVAACPPPILSKGKEWPRRGSGNQWYQ